MAENKHVDLIQAGLEDLAKLTGKPVEDLAQQSLEESERLKNSGIPSARDSGRDHILLVKQAVKKITNKKT